MPRRAALAVLLAVGLPACGPRGAPNARPDLHDRAVADGAPRPGPRARPGSAVRDRQPHLRPRRLLAALLRASERAVGRGQDERGPADGSGGLRPDGIGAAL